MRRGVEAGAAAVFACCGTGEFHALTPEEFETCVRVAVEAAEGRVPVVAGAGYGTALAVRYARLAEAAGADGLLAMPPYLVKAGQEGLLRHYRELAAATSLPVIVYQRDNAVFTPATVVELARAEGVVGLKDGYGDLDLMQRTVSAVRTAGVEEFLYFNGLPTAELTQPAYNGLGVTLYSSAVFCFAPEIALACHTALRTGDEVTVRRLTDHFYRPFVELRDQGQGYAVSLVKAGCGCAGWTWGGPSPAARAGRGSSQAARSADRAGTGAARGGHVKASAFVYPWDVNGDPGAPARIAELGTAQVTLASAYHSTRALTPAIPGTAWSPPSTRPCCTRPTSPAGPAACRPPSGRRLGAGDAFGEAAAALTDAGLEVHTWVVLAHNSRLGEEHPDTSVVNAYGDRYPWAPCIAQPDVRAYLTDLAAEAAVRPGARGTELESLGWYGLAHLHAHDKIAGVPLGDAGQYLMSLCFCPACRDGYGTEGLDADALAAAVRDALDPVWRGRRRPGRPAGYREAAGDTRAHATLAWRDRTARTLQEAAVAAVRRAAPDGFQVLVHADPVSHHCGANAGVDPAHILSVADGVVVPCTGDPGPITPFAREGREGAVLAANFTVVSGMGGSPGTLAADAAEARRLGATELRLYHAGLASDADLAAVRSALSGR